MLTGCIEQLPGTTRQDTLRVLRLMRKWPIHAEDRNAIVVRLGRTMVENGQHEFAYDLLHGALFDVVLGTCRHATHAMAEIMDAQSRYDGACLSAEIRQELRLRLLRPAARRDDARADWDPFRPRPHLDEQAASPCLVHADSAREHWQASDGVFSLFVRTSARCAALG